ncbi:hypothetical protein ARC78_02025 [Stenotrophomonas pictorum JCM 9942]|uniref:Uncharacterized protein n=1 Tax=Stenotrophomonas pictorum JCM 9942 TaxID=1236960 RepID=A0A0Q9ZZX8_9GAMM|nr:hypothetical protein ARC78_02025 [Stenotrophomonas pictorum JCM 9942]
MHARRLLSRQLQGVDAVEVMVLDSHFASVAGVQPAIQGNGGDVGTEQPIDTLKSTAIQAVEFRQELSGP